MRSISIVVPTYNRPDRLASCLAALADLDYPADRFEAVVVDDGSEKDLTGIAAPFREKLDLRLVRQENAGPATARNQGAQQARHELLAFTDDDCYPAGDWLTRLAQRLDSNPEIMVGGRTENQLAGNLYSETSQRILHMVYAFYNEDPNHATFLASCNLAVWREMFLEVGGFDVTFPLAAGEDRELCERWRRRGNRIVFAPEVIVWHRHNLGLRSFWKQLFGYGRGAQIFHARRSAYRPDSMHDAHRFLAALPGLIRQQLGGLRLHQVAGFLTLLGIWQLANLSGFYYEKLRSS